MKQIEIVLANGVKISKENRKTKVMLVECGQCGGSGQIGDWSKITEKIRNQHKQWIVQDCPECKGEGGVPITFIDKRINTREEKIIRPREY